MADVLPHKHSRALTALLLVAVPIVPAAAFATEADSSLIKKASASDPQTLIVAGSMRCNAGNGVAATAQLVDGIEGTVQTLGDHALPNGTANTYANCYEPRWGRHKPRTHPSIGDSEYGQEDAGPYVDYFGSSEAHPEDFFNYSYDLGDWHIVVLNSICVVRTEPGSEMESQRCFEETINWLEQDLAENAPERCTMAVHYHPRFSSLGTEMARRLQGLWQTLHDDGVDVVVSGRNRFYERYEPMDAFGQPSLNGMRQFIVGTGGAPLQTGSDHLNVNREASNYTDYGIVKFTLAQGGYDWEFVPVVGGTYTDSGSVECRVDAPPLTNLSLDGPKASTDWFIGPVTVSLDATDDFGLSETEYQLDDAADWMPYTGAFTVTAQGNHTIRFRSTDGGGNTEETRIDTFRIDSTPPQMDLSVDQPILWPPNGELRDVGLNIHTDGVYTTVEVTSSEGPGGADPDVEVPQRWEPGSVLKLRAERLGAGPGRIYTVTATTVDEAGNQSSDSERVIVPHDSSSRGPAPPPLRRKGAHQIVASPGAGPANDALVGTFGADGSSFTAVLDPFGEVSITHGGNLAACNLNGRGPDEIVVAPGPGPANPPTIQLWDFEGGLLKTLTAVFEETGGLELACGDVDGDRRAEIVAASPAAPGEIRVLEADGSLRSSFLLQANSDQVDLSVADIRGDGVPEIVVASGSEIATFDVDGEARSSFVAPSGQPGGVQVAGGNVVGGREDEILVAPGPNTLSPAIISTYRSDGVLWNEFGAPGIASHLDRYGYHHIQDARYGLYASDVANYTNFAHLGQPDFASGVAALGLGPLLELRLGDEEDGWQDRVDYIKSVAGDLAAVEAVLVTDDADLRGWVTAKQARAVSLANENFPGLPTLINYNDLGPGGSPFDPPPEVDWLGVYRYFQDEYDNTGCAEREMFDEAAAYLKSASSWGKPLVVFAPSFETATLGMPSECQQSWYMEAALENRSVIGLVWFMYGYGEAAGLHGVAEFPQVTELHRRLYDNVRYGGWGAELAAGDITGDGRDEIVVGNGAGEGNLTGIRVFSSEGQPLAPSFVAFGPARHGVELAVGRIPRQ